MIFIKKKFKKSSLRKNIIREIARSKSRFFSIFAIIGISVGFFTGVKSTSPSMVETAERYVHDQHLSDINLISTVGFDDDDITDILNLDSTVEVMPAYMADIVITQDTTDYVVRIYSVPEKTETNKNIINEPVIKSGRMPKNEGECVIEDYYFKSSKYKIGDTIKINPTVEGKDTLNMVKHLEYKIVGTIYDPLYFTYLRGNTNIGDGAITFYMMISPDDFAYERYTNAFVRTKASDGNRSAFSNEYKNMIEQEKPEYKKLSEKCIERFNNTTLYDAKKKLSDAQNEYNDKKKEALDKIADGEKKLMEGEQEYYKKIADARKELDDGEKELEEGRQKLEEGEQKYKDGIEEGRKKIEDGQAQYNEGLKQYKDGKLEYETKIREAESKLEAAEKEFDTQYKKFYISTKPDAESKLSLLKTTIDTCNEAISDIEQRLEKLKHSTIIGSILEKEINEIEQQLEEYRKKLAEYQVQYDNGVKQLADGERQLLEGKAKLEAGRKELESQKAQGEAKLNDAKLKLDKAQTELDNGKLEYQKSVNTGKLELEAARSKLETGERKLERGREELEKQAELGLEEMKSAREQLTEGKYTAHTQLSEAQEKLDDAQKQLDALDSAKWIVNDRDDNPGYSGLTEDAERIDNIAKVFPLFFLLVAGLVCLTTMTRMVEERRTETGTLKALGYSNADIAKKYIVYSALAAVSGSIVGSILGVFTLPYIIVDAYCIMYSLPPTTLVVSWNNLLIASVAGVICICSVSLAACFRDLKLSPAMLMRPKAPKPGKRIWLEYITPLWKHLNFTSKVTARNLFRYKVRCLMTIIGVAGCTALIITAFGLRDSTTGIAPMQFQGVTKYDEIIALSKAGTSSQKSYLMSQIHSDERIKTASLSYIGWIEAKSSSRSKKVNGRVFIGEDYDEFSKMFMLRDRTTQEPLKLTNNGVIINERWGQALKINAGDTISILLDDSTYQCKVESFTENYAGNYLYMTPEYYRSLTGKELEYNVIITQIAESFKDSEKELMTDLMKNDDIMTVTSINDQVSTILDALDSLNVVIFVMVFCAGLLAIVVLYNLTNINISERVREIATIKVLGFYSLETANFIYRENIVLTLAGALTGMILGNMFSAFVVESIQMDNVMFPKVISPLSYLFGFVLTFVFSMLVNFIMYFKMNKISMVESLKSIE